MKILSQDLAVLLSQATLDAFPTLSGEEVLNALSVDEPRDAKHGEFATGLAMKLSKRVGKAPQAIAEAIIEHFPKDYRVQAVEFAAPGFLNLKLSDAFLQEGLKQLESGFSVERGVDGGAKEERPWIVEYSSTNAAKHMGVHHIITTILGDALANLIEFMGHEVIRINHLGDWGTHFGKLIYAVEEWGDKAAIEKKPNDELTRLYVKFHEEAEKDSNLEGKARDIFKALEEGDEERLALWKWMVEESVGDLKKIFKRLGVEFDHITGESFYLNRTDEVISDGLQKKAFVEGEGGALIYPMGLDAKGEEMTPALIRKSDGTTLYLTRDLATIKYRVETWHPEVILYVVDHAQSLHFVQNFAVARALAYDRLPTASVEAMVTSLEHISFGRMSFGDRAMSTRKGNVIKLTEILDEAVKRAGALAAQRASELPREELYALAEGVGVASVKYGILSQDRNKDLVFDWDKIITLEGNSAPYLLYSYARASSILQKAEAQFGLLDLSGLPLLCEDAEKAMVKKMLKFPEALQRALEERKPHIVATFLYELCQEFNRFYGTVQVVNAETEAARRARLGIVKSFLQELKCGLSILGIPALDRM
ncbi:arginine--tRNA ligase [Candidatus Peregrinibacteria bacterium]|nr:MAG: arginine--tRNA ligase [Candidatus Peregrinibacteria bacterium]